MGLARLARERLVPPPSLLCRLLHMTVCRLSKLQDAVSRRWADIDDAHARLSSADVTAADEAKAEELLADKEIKTIHAVYMWLVGQPCDDEEEDGDEELAAALDLAAADEEGGEEGDQEGDEGDETPELPSDGLAMMQGRLQSWIKSSILPVRTAARRARRSTLPPCVRAQRVSAPPCGCLPITGHRCDMCARGSHVLQHASPIHHPWHMWSLLRRTPGRCPCLAWRVPQPPLPEHADARQGVSC